VFVFVFVCVYLSRLRSLLLCRCALLQEIQLATGNVALRNIGVEVNVLHRSQSPYIVKFFGCFLAQTSVYLCMEFMDYGSLDRLFAGGVPEPVLGKIAYAVRA
jgi:mitogen-activated protein kinase kinase